MNVAQIQWLVWSNEHDGWWAPHGNGYVKKRDDAGRFSFEQASEYLESANWSPELKDKPNETLIPDL